MQGVVESGSPRYGYATADGTAGISSIDRKVTSSIYENSDSSYDLIRNGSLPVWVSRTIAKLCDAHPRSNLSVPTTSIHRSERKEKRNERNPNWWYRSNNRLQRTSLVVAIVAVFAAEKSTMERARTINRREKIAREREMENGKNAEQG